MRLSFLASTFSILSGCGLFDSITPTPRPKPPEWLSGFTLGQNGLNNVVNSMATLNDKLLAGGTFTIAGQAAALRVAEWNGTAWTNLNEGFNAQVDAVTSRGNTWIAAGPFTNSGMPPVHNLARWNGFSWTEIDQNPNPIRGLTTYQTDLIVVGTFGGGGKNNVASWNGTSWGDLGAGTNGTVNSAVTFGTNLVIAGTFTVAGGVATNNIASWNGTTWEPLGSGTLGDYPVVLAVYHGDLIAGLNQAGGAPMNHIARWNGSWNSVGSGLNGKVNGLGVWNDLLIAVGEFTEAGGQPANHIAAWDGTAWSPLGDGLNDVGNCVAALGDNLFVGGAFTVAGGIPSDYVAVWGPPP